MNNNPLFRSTPRYREEASRSWWTDLDRDHLKAAIDQEVPRMRRSQMGQWKFGTIVGFCEVKLK